MEFCVVVNQEEQFSIWSRTRELPLGWTRVDIPEEWLERYRHARRADAGSFDKQTCLDYIDDTWKDIRPLSVRRALNAQS